MVMKILSLNVSDVDILALLDHVELIILVVAAVFVVVLPTPACKADKAIEFNQAYSRGWIK